MIFKWIVLCLWAWPVLIETSGEKKCPVDCVCGLDTSNRMQTLCLKGGLTSLPVNDMEPDVKILIIKGPRNYIILRPVLMHVPKLEILRITESNIPALGSQFFWGLKYLRILDLSKNNITNITENSFRGQDNLQELDLSHNKIMLMSSSTFRHLTNLSQLNLAENNIIELVQRNFFMLNKLEFLDLSGNPLHDLQPDVFRDIPGLKVLKCRNCQLKKINPQLYNLLPLLRELDFGYNEFKFLDNDEFRDLKHLTKVMLDGNQLSVVVDELFAMQKNLDYLDLSHNRLAKIPNNSFKHQGNLTFLDLSYNKLVRLEPRAVRRLNNLQVLNISGNPQMDLHEVRETFKFIPQLTHLSIADMGILPIGLLAPFRQLRFLNISGNQLDNIALQVIEPCRDLEFLDISRNQLYGISEDTALRIQDIRNVRLDNNPLICDECHMGKLINIVRHLQWTWETRPLCFLPKNLRGAEITNLDISGLEACLEYISDEEQNAASTSHNFLDHGGFNALSILCGIILVLVGITIVSMVVCFSKHRARYYTREDHLNESERKCFGKNVEPAIKITKANELHDEGGDVGYEDPCCDDNEINFKFPTNERVCTVGEFGRSLKHLPATTDNTCYQVQNGTRKPNLADQVSEAARICAPAPVGHPTVSHTTATVCHPSELHMLHKMPVEPLVKVD